MRWLAALVAALLSAAALAQEPIENATRRRAEIVLNGVWKFVPVDAATMPADEASWGTIRVPGDWTVPASARGTSDRPGIVENGPAWTTAEVGSSAGAWYRRALTVPTNWQGRAVLLDLARVSTDADVFLDGQPCGAVAWPSGTVDLTAAVRPGQEQVLALHVRATGAALLSRGLIGDVILQSRPAGPHVASVFVRPSVRNKRLDLDLDLAGAFTPGAAIAITARLVDRQGRVARTFTARKSASERIAVGWPWADPMLWDIGRPALYRMTLSVTGAGIDDSLLQTFGFREFWVTGRDFYLNGTKIRLRPQTAPEEWSATEGTTELIDAAIDGLMAAGHNLIELWPVDPDERGRPLYHDRWAERADRRGVLLTGVLPQVHAALIDEKYTFHGDDAHKAAWLARCMPVLERLRNHPSIVMWSPSANLFGSDLAPRALGQRRQARNSWGTQVAGAGREALAAIRQLDPTRPVFTHEGGDVGDVYTANLYLDLIPLQERMEWLSLWARSASALPLWAVEFGTPLHTTFLRGRVPFGETIHSEPWLTEFAAIYLGADAYRQETPAYRQRVLSSFEGGQRYANWQGAPELERSPVFQEIERRFIVESWRSWRVAGISGGMVPWNLGHGWYPSAEGATRVPMPPFVPGRRGTYPDSVPLDAQTYLRSPGMDRLPAGDALVANNRATLIALVGGAPAQTDRTHNLLGGTPLNKRIALINDARTPQRYRLAWDVKVGRRFYRAGILSGRLAPAQTLLLRLPTVTLPVVGQKSDALLTLAGRIGDQEHDDEFAFRVWPAIPARPNVPAVSLVDPIGRTAALLKTAGIATKPFVPGGTGLVVIGREALSKGRTDLARFESLVAGGGRLLVFSQDPQWLRERLGLRVSRVLARRVFPIDPRHLVVAGLDTTDLRDWTGSSTLLPPFPDYREGAVFERAPSGMPAFGWRWGGRHAVSTGAIEKPHRSGWRPLLETEFDLAYTPLMELDYGKGRITLCQLDLEDHAADPAARRLLVNLLRMTATAPLMPRRARTVYVGGDAGARTLDGLGVAYEHSETIPDDSDSTLVVGADVPLHDNAPLTAFLTAGGRALLLARPEGAETLNGATLKRADAVVGMAVVPRWPETRGLSESDLRRRTPGEAVLIDGALLARVPVGRGIAIQCQVDPATLDADDQTYLRFTRWRFTRALSQLLANLGATFTVDRRVFGKIDGTGTGWYHPDYRDDFALGDEPMRYFRW
jgi:beta-galactosidase